MGSSDRVSAAVYLQYVIHQHIVSANTRRVLRGVKRSAMEGSDVGKYGGREEEAEIECHENP